MDRWQVMEELAHAKINLSLRVLGQRTDGFHEMETLLTPITLHDAVRIEPAPQFEFRCNDLALSAGEENLVVRAARGFFATTKIEPAVSITLEKNIPHGAGLGGGSSDAAATLRALSKFFRTKISEENLNALAAQLGSDVPFFMSETAALCRGRGEKVTPVRLSAPLKVLLLKPEFGVPTAWAYSRWREATEIPGVRYVHQEFGGQSFVNDLERPVFEKFSFLAVMKSWLIDQAEVAVGLMSGSGSTLFAVLNAQVNVNRLIARARRELDLNVWAFATETC